MSFRQVQVILPPQYDCIVLGFLYDSDDYRDLGQDMVEVRLPGGVKINAGWYPEGNPGGAYMIKTWGAIELQPMRTTDVDDALEKIQWIVRAIMDGAPLPVAYSQTVHQERLYQVA